MSPDGVILVHGGLHTSRCWAALCPLLDLPVRAIELPGRGLRPADLATVTLDDCVEAVMDEADTADFERFALVGHSLGGLTITETGYRHGERITHLVYVGALVPALESSASIAMTGDDMEAMSAMSSDTARALFGNDLSQLQWDEHFKTLVPEAVGLMNARLSGYPSGIPTTYINMSQDVPVPPGLAEQMIANLGPGVTRHTLDAGHTVMVSQPAALAALINVTLAC